MNVEENRTYINQIAFSSVEELVERSSKLLELVSAEIEAL